MKWWLVVFALAGCSVPTLTGDYVRVSTTQEYSPLDYPSWTIDYLPTEKALKECTTAHGCVKYMDSIGVARVVIDKDRPDWEMKPLIAHECQHLAWGPEHE